MNKKKTNMGQSVVEVIFLIGALGMVLTGTVVLLLNSVNSRTKSFDRKKASEMAEYVIEGLIDEKINDPATFWNKINVAIGSSKIEPQFSGYTYSVGFSNVGNAYGCGDLCYEARVAVVWTRDVGKSIMFTRLFSK